MSVESQLRCVSILCPAPLLKKEKILRLHRAQILRFKKERAAIVGGRGKEGMVFSREVFNVFRLDSRISFEEEGGEEKAVALSFFGAGFVKRRWIRQTTLPKREEVLAGRTR